VRNRFDMVAIIRGGGGDIGLSCYDDYHLAREIATFPLPVITGIGHATNETIAEMVAWSNKITPTDVAYFIVDRYRSYQQRIDNATSILHSRTSNILNFNRQALDHISGILHRQVPQFLSNEKNLLQKFSSSLVSNARAVVKQQANTPGMLAMKISAVLPGVISSHYCTLDKIMLKLQFSTSVYMEKQNNDIAHLETRTGLLDPVNVMKRGYSITLLNGKTVTKASQIKQGDTLTTRLFKGEIKSKVEEDPS
jgi:exodeoxyribonuclease VII large subunit